MIPLFAQEQDKSSIVVHILGQDVKAGVCTTTFCVSLYHTYRFDTGIKAKGKTMSLSYCFSAQSPPSKTKQNEKNKPKGFFEN